MTIDYYLEVWRWPWFWCFIGFAFVAGMVIGASLVFWLEDVLCRKVMRRMAKGNA